MGVGLWVGIFQVFSDGTHFAACIGVSSGVPLFAGLVTMGEV